MLTVSIALCATLLPSGACPDSLPEQGRCEGERRLLWCEDGEAKSFDCPVDTTCAWSEALHGFDCVLVKCERDLDRDGQADPVPATGLCVEGRVVWCDKGHVRELTCLPGVTCGWNAGIGAYDCVSTSGEDAGTADDAGSTDADDGEDDGYGLPDAGGRLPGGSGVKPVQNDAGASDDLGVDAAPTSAGCAAGPRTGGAWLLLALIVPWLRRRPLAGGSRSP